MENRNISLKSFTNRPIALVFVTTGSWACIEELKYLSELKNEINFEIIAVFLGNDPSDIQTTINTNNFNFTILNDQNQKSTDQYRILIAPTLYLIDKKGILQNIIADYDRGMEGSMREAINKIAR